MPQITLSSEESMRILTNPDSSPDSRVIAACAMAMLEAGRHADEIEASTRSIALKLSHMVAEEIYSADLG